MKRWIGLLLVLCLLPCTGLAEEEDYVCAQPGDSGGDVRIILEAAHNLGILKELAEDEETYLEEYVPAVQALEKALSLEADGIIRLSEIEAIDGLMYPGARGPEVAFILRKLAVLGYIKDLPDNQDIYDKKYSSAVKSAEKKLSLTADGYLTKAEQKVIRSQPGIKPDDLKNLKAVSRNGKAVLTWSASKNAVSYTIKRDNVKVASVKGTSWTDNDAEMGMYYEYTVIPERYSETGLSKTEGIYVEPVYKSVDINTLYANLDSYISTHAYVTFQTIRTKKFSVEWDGNSIYFLFPCSGNKYIYLYCDGYKNWTWRNASAPLPHKAKDMKVTAKGTVKGKKRHNGVDVPVIDVSDFNYTYWN